MVSKLNKCSELDITAILLTESDSEKEPESQRCDNATPLVANSQVKGKTELQNATKNNLNESSDIEAVYENIKYPLPKCRILQRRSVSLKIKFRRSSEQSLYKIDTDSERERSAPKSRDKLRRQRKQSFSEMENEEFMEDDSGQHSVERNSKGKLSRRSRIRRPPLRFSSYHCDTLPNISPPSLRNRKTINYNEDNLLLSTIVGNYKTYKQLAKNQKPTSDNSPQIEKSNAKNNKRNRTPSTKGDENNSGTDSMVAKTKALKQSNKSENLPKDASNDTPKVKETKEKQNSIIETPTKLQTPVKSSKQKRVMCESTQKNIQHLDNNNFDNNEKNLTDMYKRIKITSASKTATPKRTYAQRKMSAKTTPLQIRDRYDAKSDVEEDNLSEMYERIQISSAKKHAATPQKRNKARKNIEFREEGTQPSTPKSRPIKCSSLTPSLGKRFSALMKPTTPLQEARSRLHVSAVPKSLPCREEEFNNIFTFLRGKLEDKSGGCIYISGVPGTGKTATVNEAVRCLQKLIIKRQLDDFDYVAINGMKLTEPRQAYVQILKQLDGKTATWEQSYRMLEKRFHSRTSKMTLLLVDELDFLCTKRQDVVYNLLDWPTKSTAQLVVITIANTMDLPERVLMGRVTSRLGLTRLTFQPYNYKQLQEIVMSRLKGFNGFRSEAVQLVSRKVSAVSGDARRALDICRRAMEIAESRNGETISLQDVSEAVSEMIASAKVQAIKHCSKMEQIFLQAVSAEVTRTSIEEVFFKDAYRQLESLCSFDGIEIPTVSEVLAVCARLGANRLLICEHSRNDIYQKILLNVSTDDIHFAIQQLDLD